MYDCLIEINTSQVSTIGELTSLAHFAQASSKLNIYSMRAALVLI